MYQQEEYDVADCLHRRSLKIDEEIFGADHPKVASDLKNWADSLFEQVRSICRRRYIIKFLVGNISI